MIINNVKQSIAEATGNNPAIDFAPGLKKDLDKGQLVALATTVAGIALGVLGVITSATGNLALGIALIAVSSALIYSGANSFSVINNAKDVVKKPGPYLKDMGIGAQFDEKKLRAKLDEDTFAFGWATRLLVENSDLKEA